MQNMMRPCVTWCHLWNSKRHWQTFKVEVELGFDPALAAAEAQRCLNCDVQTVFTEKVMYRV